MEEVAEVGSKDRRLIVVAVEVGENLEVDWDGDFAYWELLGALRGALKMVIRQEVEAMEDEDDDDEP